MTAKKDMIPIEEFEGGSHEQLFNLLDEEAKIQARLDEIQATKAEIAQMLCAEAMMTEVSKKKSIKFKIKGREGIVIAKRMDRTEFIDPEIEMSINVIKAKYEAKMKPIKDEMNTAKKMLEVTAINDGKARKKPSFYANFDSKEKQESKNAEE